jgi:ferritin-like metal-binding protein YciE
MAKNATSKLIHAFESHLKETEEHVTRLEKIFESLSQSSCQEMRCNGGTT